MAKGGDGGAGQIRADEDARNKRVQKNIADINLQFGGSPASKRGTGTQTSAFVPGQTYYDAAGNATVPVPNAPAAAGPANPATGYLAALMPTVGKGTPKAASPLYTGVEDVPAVAGFDNDYFKNVADAYLNYQTPLLNEQADVARRALPSRFASTSSSAYQREAGNLERDIQREMSNLSDKSLDFSNQQRSAVENNRSDLIGMANSGTDASALATQTAARMAALAKPPAYSPITDLFSKYAAQAGSYAQAKMYDQINQAPLYYGAGQDATRNVR